MFFIKSPPYSKIEIINATGIIKMPRIIFNGNGKPLTHSLILTERGFSSSSGSVEGSVTGCVVVSSTEGSGVIGSVVEGSVVVIWVVVSCFCVVGSVVVTVVS